MKPVTFIRTVSIQMPDETLLEIDLEFTATYEPAIPGEAEDEWEITDVSLGD